MNYYQDEYNQFRRLHPLTLLYSFIKNIPYIAATVYFGIFQNQMEELVYILLFVLLGMFIIPGHILRWYYFTFMITESEIIIKSGVFSRKQRNIPIERVQNINVKQDLIQRILGIARIQIETAGDITAEGTLEFVKLKDADDINRIIRTYQKNLISNEKPIVESQSEGYFESKFGRKSETYNPSESGNVLFEMSRKDLLIYGMIRLRPLFLIYGIWAMSYITQYQKLNDIVTGYLEETVNSIADVPLHYLIPIIILFVLLSVIISWLIDICWTFAQFYGFRLIQDGNKLFASYGLFSKYSITIPLKKLQQITIGTNPVKKKFNFYSMVLYTAGYDVSAKAAPSAVPLAKKEILEQIAAKIFPVVVPTEFKSISEKSIRRAFLRYLMLMIPLFISSYFIFDFYALLGIIILPGLYYAAFLRWQYRGYLIQSDVIFVKQGFWNQKINIIPIEKIQTLHITESFFQRRLELATVHIDTASSRNFSDALIPDIDTETATEIMNELNLAFKLSNKVRVS
jgi:putative membrane protein